MESLSVGIALFKKGFYAGEMVRGTCVVSTMGKQGIKINRIIVILRGVIAVTGRNADNRFHAVNERHHQVVPKVYRRRSEFLLIQQAIPVPQGGVYPGSPISAPFEIELPQSGQLLTSVEHEHGYVRYRIEIVLPDLCEDTKPHTTSLQIYDIIDTNTPESLMNGPDITIAQQNGDRCASPRSLSITGTAKFDRTVYVPGEIIKATCEIENHMQASVTPYIAVIRTERIPHITERTNFSSLFSDRPAGLNMAEMQRLQLPEGILPITLPEGFRGQVEITGVIPTMVTHNVVLMKYQAFASPKKLLPTFSHPFMQFGAMALVGFIPDGSAHLPEFRSEPVKITLGTVPLREHSTPIVHHFQPLPEMDAATLKFLSAAYETKPTVPDVPS